MISFLASSTVARVAVLLLIFAVVALGAFALMAYFSRRATVRSGLESIRQGSAANVSGLTSGAEESSLRASDRSSAWSKLADGIERAGLDLTDTKSDRLREKMVAAGFTSPAAPRIFTLVRLVMVLLLPTIYVVLAFTGAGEPPSFFKVYLYGCLLALLGLYIPNLFVRARADRRREAIVNGFPDCLDLILVCIEAGLGIEAAMNRVGREMVHSHPLVAEMLSATVLQLRAGATREEAFRKLADRAAVDEIRSFTTLLVQSDKLGTSISSTLRVYAGEMRERRRMRAEEKAHRLPVLISIPLVVFMLPTMIGVLMLPASIRVVREIFPMMSGG